MRKEIYLALGLLLMADTALAGSIYKCDTEEGVVFSQRPCAPDAVRISAGRKRAGQSTNGKAVDAALFDQIRANSAKVIIETVGRPAASYIHDDIEHWLYPNVVKEADGQRVSPELLLENGQHTQTNWIPEEIMKNSVEAARAFADWVQPAFTQEKTFFVGDTVVMGRSKSQVLGKLGEPDAKRVHRGREVWEYREVRFSASTPETLTIYLTFDGDIVASSAGK